MSPTIDTKTDHAFTSLYSLIYWWGKSPHLHRLGDKIQLIVLKCFVTRYATEVDVDFVRKSVRAIGRCAIKVEQAAERCVSTLLDLIQTKVNYVVQEAIVVIKVRYSSLVLLGVSVVDRDIGRERFWGSHYKNIAPPDIGSGQGLEIILWDIVNKPSQNTSRATSHQKRSWPFFLT